MPGRKRKSSDLRKLEGRRGHSRPLTDDVEAAPGHPRVPVHLSAEERALWVSVVGAMPKNIYRRADEALLESFSVDWSTFREAHRLIKSTGLMVQSPLGPVRNPLLVVRNNASRGMLRAASELGLSPAARARLANVDTDPDDDPMTLLLGDDGDEDGAWSTGSRSRN